MEFSHIHKTLELFKFPENFCKWVRVFLKGGKSCISNNGFLSEKFEIKRSTRQGDPLSPLVFILALEILLIAIRSDSNIRGVKIDGQEIKLSVFADDSTYFIRDEHAALNLLSTIESFSKISGLQINRSKSECLILQFESQVANYEESIFGIPIVDDVKVLGHYFGKNKMVCNYQNFYSKLTKMEKIVSIWK